ncbi:acylneuraminate cytidylyltransferase family protein [Butyrivibrio sp. XPD2002]|uniref:acylneuraminate cytidylyltransferase family protein n=1 Tax=Butyrivibrio sp. XPD2002 TaxID=1280665 RepID=UPI00047AD69B|nr:acylneuraminate cytidylyltransferase family protein [Butyrivibrio sp. XPD2002]
MKNIAIIPARSGSKGLVDKNIKELVGKPLMAYSIEAALKSKYFDTVMVSTDSESYADIARKYGAEVPFLRSERTSSDTASSWDMVEEVLDGYRKREKFFDTFCLLQPTSPLRNADDIIAAYKLFEKKASFAVVSVCEAEHSPLWCGQLPANKEFINFLNPESEKRRQDAGTFYRLNGAIYIVYIEKFNNDKFLYKEGSYAYIMPQNRSLDIDTDIDFKLAEILMQKIII